MLSNHPQQTYAGRDAVIIGMVLTCLSRSDPEQVFSLVLVTRTGACSTSLHTKLQGWQSWHTCAERLVCKSEVMMYCTGLLLELLAGAPVHTLESSACVMKAWMSLVTLPAKAVPVSTPPCPQPSRSGCRLWPFCF